MMTDEELIARLQDSKGWPLLGKTAAARIEALIAERDKAYASGYSDAETEISKSALGQRIAFLNAEYSNAAACIKRLTTERDEALAHGRKYEGAWMTAEGRLSDAEAERDRWIEHTKNAVWADSAELKQSQAENERLREALVQALAVMTADTIGTIYMDDPDWYRNLGDAVDTARAALEGETP